MSKILVTGAGGFIGSHFSEYLMKKRHKNKVFIHYNSHNFLKLLKNQNMLI